ncbi:MAG: DUF362 domain-containing protein [Planctomycetales bacterium]|nr:DUF362 domain-containing protein [Planctomycetales bacterium]
MNPNDRSLIDRRSLLGFGGLAAAGLVAAPTLRSLTNPHAAVFVARNQSYAKGLAQTIRDGLLACGVSPDSFRGKRVLLKPNLVEPTRLRPHMTTHPAVILAAAEAFRVWGATVTVGEAPGHVRDTEMALVESGVGEALADGGLTFADLNYEEVGWRRNRGRYSGLKGMYFPRSVLEADVVVSMPKMKTHHWVGVTCGMKNLYGVMPGIKYGWPKNVLHHNGIPQTVADINATLPRKLAIVDGVDCMEGDGPILGSKKSMGLIVVGASLPAVDATVARIMGLEPSRIEYMTLASHHLGTIDDARIEQRGEKWQSVAEPFQILNEEHLQKLRATPAGELVT